MTPSARTDIEPRAPTRPAILWNVLVALLHAVLHTILVVPRELFWQCHLSSTNGSRSNGNTPLSLDTSDCNPLIKSCDGTLHHHVLFLVSSSTEHHGCWDARDAFELCPSFLDTWLRLCFSSIRLSLDNLRCLLPTPSTRALVVCSHLAASPLGNGLRILQGNQDLLGLLKGSFPLRSMRHIHPFPPWPSPEPGSTAPIYPQATVQETRSCGQHHVILAISLLTATIRSSNGAFSRSASCKYCWAAASDALRLGDECPSIQPGLGARSSRLACSAWHRPLIFHTCRSQAVLDLGDLHGLLQGLNGENLSLFNETAVSPILRMLTFLNAFSLISLHILESGPLYLTSFNDWIFQRSDPSACCGLSNFYLVFAFSMQ